MRDCASRFSPIDFSHVRLYNIIVYLYFYSAFFIQGGTHMNYVFMTDSDSDLPYDLKVKYDIPVVNMPYALNGKEYFDDLGQTINSKDYFDAMRNGAVPITSALNETAYMEIFEPILKEHDLLFVAFSSKMSSTIHAIEATRKELLEKYPLSAALSWWTPCPSPAR